MAADFSFDLPEAMIHVVQSFLTSKEAARTTILSKSWGSAWLTRPNLDFDLHSNSVAFAEKTLERYENSNLRIHSLRLSLYRPYNGSCEYSRHVTKLVRRALKLGPTRLTFEPDESNQYVFLIPDEVYRYENLLSLTVSGCEIGPNPEEEICCSRLQFLSLKDIWIHRHASAELIFRIMSSCPLIEKLSLCHIVDFYHYSVVGNGDRLPTINLHRLTSLVLDNVFFDSLFLADLSLKLPSLKDLFLLINNDGEEILISSPTLERLCFDMTNNTVEMVKLDVPSIRKLTFDCTSIPKLSVRSNSTRGWESRVTITRGECLSALWFYKLNHFLSKLRFSRISLSLLVNSQATFEYEPGDIRSLPKPEIENLNIYYLRLPSVSCYVLFDGLFRTCRPKVITQYMSRESVPITHNHHFLVKRFLQAREAKVLTKNYQFMYGLNDLEEASAQVFNEDVSTWRDVTLELLLDEDSTTSEDDHQSDDEPWDRCIEEPAVYDSNILDLFPVIRFHLNWKQ